MRKRKPVDRPLEETAAIALKKEKEFERERIIKLANYEHLLHNNTIAQDLLWDILDMTGFSGIHRNPDNSLILAEGKRHVGFEIVELLNEIDPMLYPSLILERGKRYGYREYADRTSDTGSTDTGPTDDPDADDSE